jgi:deazaflavin-dependent oxidoreductase (nitroreductase family)
MTGLWIVAGVLVAGAVFFVLVLPLLERIATPRMLRLWWKVSVPFMRPFAAFAPGWAVVETKGRRTGRAWSVPVGGKLRDGAFWFSGVRTADYVKNLTAEPRVRVRTMGRWRTGTAHLLDESELRRVLFMNRTNGFFLTLTGQDMVPIRVDLDDR